MAKTVKLKIDVVAGGIPEIKSALKSVAASAQSSWEKVAIAAQKAAAKQIAAAEKAAAKEISLANKVQAAKESAIRKEIRLRQQAARNDEKILNDYQRQARRAQDLNNKRTSFGPTLSAVGHLAQAGGFYRIGHLLRMGSMLEIGSEMGAAGGGAAGAGAMASLASAAGPAAAGLALLYVQAKLVETGFNVVSTEAEHLASAFVGAISEIGGIKNLQQMLVESANRPESLGAATLAVTPGERLSPEELKRRTNLLVSNPAFGIKTVEEADKAQAILAKYGFQKSISQDTLEFIAKGAKRGRMDMSEFADIYGRTVAINPGKSQDEIQNLILTAFAKGMKGSISPSDIPQATNLLQAGSMIGGDKIANQKLAFGIGAMTAPFAGGIDPAGTYMKRFIEQAEKGNQEGRLSGYSQFFDKKGHIKDQTAFEELSAELVAKPKTERAKVFNQMDAGLFLTGLEQRAGITGEESTQEQIQKVKALYAEFDNLSLSMQDFNDDNKKTQSTGDEWRAAIHRATTELEDSFAPMLDELSPNIKLLSDAIVKNKDNIISAMQALLNAMLALVPAVLEAAIASTYLGQLFGTVMIVLADYLDAATLGAFHDVLGPMAKSGYDVIASQQELRPAIENLMTDFESLSKKIQGMPGVSGTTTTTTSPTGDRDLGPGRPFSEQPTHPPTITLETAQALKETGPMMQRAAAAIEAAAAKLAKTKPN